MIVLALVATALAALVHVYIFVLEAVLWTTPRARAAFQIATEQEAQSTRLLALNQGFYNLFLAVGSTSVGSALVVAAAGSMLAASVVLVVSMPAMRRAAVVQGAPPLVALVALAISRSM